MQGLRGSGASDYCDGMIHRLHSSALILLFALSSLPGCGLVDRVTGRSPEGAVSAGPLEAVPNGPLSATKPLGGAQSAAALDQTTAAEKALATAAPAQSGERNLGAVIVALGSPAEQGFWLQSSLVSAPGNGRVVTDTGKSVAVDLRPASGTALLSLAAYRALGLGLTDLPKVQVYAN